jgi:small subunit ribosomal protein S8
MSQDVIADGLNQIINANKAKKKTVFLKKSSKLLKNILDMAKQDGYLDYSVDGKEIKVEIKRLNEFKAIKPRFTTSVDRINYYVRRFLPAKNFGFVIVSTNQGLIKHSEAEEKNPAGCFIAYIY